MLDAGCWVVGTYAGRDSAGFYERCAPPTAWPFFDARGSFADRGLDSALDEMTAAVKELALIFLSNRHFFPPAFLVTRNDKD